MKRYIKMPRKILVERAKELECLYLIDEALLGSSGSDVLLEITKVIPSGFRDINACAAAIVLDGRQYSAKPYENPGDELQAEIIVNSEILGYVKVMYPKNTFPEGDTVFLDQERRLLNTIATRIAENIFRKKLNTGGYQKDWATIINLLEKTDHDMLLYVCEKMLALLARINPNLREQVFKEMDWVKYEIQGEINYPLETVPAVDAQRLSKILFSYASASMDNAQIYNYISLWIYQGKTHELIKIVDKKDADAKKIARALRKYINAVKDHEMPSEATKRWLTAELARRFLTDNPKLISNIQKHFSIESFSKFLDTFICSPKSIGRVGGKGAGFFIANQIIKSKFEQNPVFNNIKIPMTWYISSDELSYLLEENKLDELNGHKYLDILDIRTGYPRIIQMLKNSKLSSYVMNELRQVLDACHDRPLIVRSSSLLEDQVDSSFSGKYKSLFLTNTGTKAERLDRLVEGILEVYASLFNPDSIQYRKERDLLDCCEQMGILIQEVIGSRVGPYFFPLYAGVAFSNNELRWSPRIRREHGLLRMVMGLGTRAVDRVGGDFPVLVSPGQPDLRVNQSPVDLKKYSPQLLDAIDLENNQFVTVPIPEIIRKYGNEIPNIHLVASVMKNDLILESSRLTTDFQTDEIVITFDGLIKKTPVVEQVRSILNILKENLGYPVDIEFASDGKYFYLLQCRPQSRNYDNAPVAIPSNIPFQSTVFTANRYISNGRIAGIDTVVYVDPLEYGRLEKHEDFQSVGHAVSELNRVLPRRSFILAGPGRWGSRGDIKLGVPVSYSDINNTAMLIEIADKESKYQPELSFGTHFFQDLVEENIKYLPLYPEDKDVIFNSSFFSGDHNALKTILPAFSHLADVVRVIQVDKVYFGKKLVVLMNADLEKAVAYLDQPMEGESNLPISSLETEEYLGEQAEQCWKWRHYMAEKIALQMDMEAFGVKGIYLFGSTNNRTAGWNSDIDLIIHKDGTEEQTQALDTWLNGWSLALSEMNYLKTGYKSDGLLDVHYVTDGDIERKTSHAMLINSLYDPVFPLRKLQPGNSN